MEGVILDVGRYQSSRFDGECGQGLELEGISDGRNVGERFETVRIAYCPTVIEEDDGCDFWVPTTSGNNGRYHA